MSEKLKPCPFCGKESALTRNDGAGFFYVWCIGCGAKTTKRANEDEVHDAWNLRAEPPAAPDDPARYSRGGIECIDAIRAALTPEEFRGYCKGCVLKYVWREGWKGGDADLAKAADYLRYATEGGEA